MANHAVSAVVSSGAVIERVAPVRFVGLCGAFVFFNNMALVPLCRAGSELCLGRKLSPECA